MNSMVDKPLRDMSITDLSNRCSIEMGKYRRRESSNDQYCLEIFRLAVEQRNEDAWGALYKLFSDYVHRKFHSHPCREAGLHYYTEQTYVDEAFKRFWQWATRSEKRPQFRTTSAVLTFLYFCLNSAIMDTLRAYKRSKEQPFTAHSLLNDSRLLIEDRYNQNEWWEAIECIMTNKRERRVVYLQYRCGLRPKDILLCCPGEFHNEQEIYRLTRCALDHLRRNGEEVRWQLGNGEV